MKRGRLGVSGTVSALLTVLLLVAGFSVSTGLLAAIYSAQSEVLKKAVNVGEAVSERLQAFLYEDARTNRTLLTVRNVGSTGSEVEYLMAVGYDGSVLKEVRLAETIRLGTQQAYTTYLSKLLGSEFDNYTDVRPRMAVLYLKTVKGGVFGSAYMAPPSVMTAAYATSTTTLSTTQTSTEQLMVLTGVTMVTTWTATVVISNPAHWPVETYVGMAFMRDIPTGVYYYQSDYWGGSRYWYGYWHWGGHITPGTAGFPDWGLESGLEATDQGGNKRAVTATDIKLPKGVARYYDSGVYGFIPMQCWHDYTWSCSPAHWVRIGGGWTGWIGANKVGAVARFSRLGPTYIDTGTEERFEPRMMMPRLEISGTTTRDLRDKQYATFPGMIVIKTELSYQGNRYVYEIKYRLAYVKVVDMWNTTNVITYVKDSGTVNVTADRPLGIAAVYVFDSEYFTPPPPPSTQTQRAYIHSCCNLSCLPSRF
jgi:hypothetical protein